MSMGRMTFRSLPLTVSAWLLVWVLSGCATLGPNSIKTGRAVYNQAINKTESEQLLMSIVQNRYGESNSMLVVQSVTANVRITTRAEIQVGVGPSEDYAGNLVPLGGAFAYEENPTISYLPVQGERYVRQFMSPLPLSVVVLFARSYRWETIPFKLFVNSINDINNFGFAPSPEIAEDVRFLRVTALMSELSVSRELVWLVNPERPDEYYIEIRNYAPDHLPQVRELLDLLELRMPTDTSVPIVLEVIHSTDPPGPQKFVTITTRSIFDIMEILAAAVDVPDDDKRSGVAENYPPTGPAVKDIRILQSDSRPANASVAVQYRGSWFYIDDTDSTTKLVFRLLRGIWTERISSTGSPQAAPVLTIPVSR